MLPQTISLTHLGNKLLTVELILWHPLHLSPGWPTKKHKPNFVGCKITELKRTMFQKYLAKDSSNNKTAAKLITSTLLITTSVMQHLFSFFFYFSSLSYLLSFLFLFSTFFQRECHLIICLLSRSIMNVY